MRHLRLLLIVGLVLAVSSPAWAVTIPFRHAWNGEFYMHISNFDDSTLYDWNGGKLADNVTSIVLGTAYAPGLVKSFAGIATKPGENAWGVFQVNQILQAEVVGPNNIKPTSPDNTLFLTGDAGVELVGIFYGGADTSVSFLTPGALGLQQIISGGYTIDFYTQPVATYNGGGPIAGPGASTRTALGNYPTIGFTAADVAIAGSELVLRLASQPGIVTDEFLSTFTPDGGGSGSGQFNFYASVIGGTMATQFNTNVFPVLATAAVPGTTADIRFKGTSDVTFKDWLVSSSDPVTGAIVPEPVTMAGLLMGLGCLGRYIRKRK